jgi:soluble lytic murein transglycosylase
VRDWVKAYGDPRDPKVDPVDWVERIPFSETRNYVQRVIENLAVYRVRFDVNTTATAKADARVVTQETNAAPGPAR